MSLYYSTSLRNKILGKAAAVIASKGGATLSYVDGGAGSDTITDGGSEFITKGFAPGMYLFTFGSTTAANNLSGVLLTGVAAGTLTFATGTVDTAEAFPAGGYAVGVWGTDLRGLLHHGVIDVFTVGSGIPADADAAITGSLVVRITVASGAWAAGAFANGLLLGIAASGTIAKNSDVWSGVGLIAPSAVMSHFRWKSNATDADHDDSVDMHHDRIQGTVGVGSSYNMNVGDTTLLTGATLTIDSASFTPAAYV